MSLPAAIIFINGDFNTTTQITLSSQLKIDEVITKVEFDTRISVDPNYGQNITLNSMRILVILSSFQDLINRELADIVLFFKQGMISIQYNKYGPPGLTFPIDRINMYELLRYVGSNQVVILPVTATKPPHACGHGCGSCLGGILAIQSSDTSGVHCPNSDNIYNNPDFINRK